MNIRQYLNDHSIEFESVPHRETFTASTLADALHEPGDFVAKTVVLKADGEYVLAVLPSSYTLALLLAQSEIGCDRLELAHEDELEDLFPDRELGAVPPFGSFYGLRTWGDSRLAEDEYIVFDGQSHEEALQMSYSSYEAIESPLIGDLSSHP